MTRAAIVGLAVGILAIALAPSSRASLHHPTDHTGVVSVDEKGVPEVYPFEELKRRRVILRNVGNPDWPLEAVNPKTKEKVIDPKSGKPILTERGVVAERIKKEEQKRRPSFGKAQKSTPEEDAALAVDLLRFGRFDAAEEVLIRQRSGFLPNITLAHIAIAQGQWTRAYNYLDIANEETPPPSLASKSPHTLAWQRKLDRGPLMKLVKLRLAESRGPKPPEDEQPDRIFNVNFVNDAGQYEPGKLAAAEKAKLPGGDFHEAIAEVQQLVLWFPYDVRLYWLLGELYAARGDVKKGDLKSAQDIMDECAWSLKYSNRKMLMQHRDAVTKLANVESPPPPPETPPPPAVPFSISAIWIYFGAVGAIALFALARAMMKKGKGGNNCGPVG